MPAFDIHAFDIWDEEQAQHIFEIYDEMNRSGPVTWAETYGGHWVVSGYDAVRKTARDWRTFTSAQGVQVPPVGPDNLPPITADPPTQLEYRQFLNPFFSPDAVQAFEPSIRTRVTMLIDGFIETGHCDLVLDFAELLVPWVFFAEVFHASPELVDSFMARTVVPGATPYELGIAAVEVSREIVAYRRSQPPLNDVIDAIFAARVYGRLLTDEEVSGVVQILFLGGTDTTGKVIGSALHHMATQPEIRAALISRPDLKSAAVEEFLRLLGSAQTIGRTATCDTVIGSQQIPGGSKLVCALAAANRDPSRFENPHDFDLNRPENHHVAFGFGTHRCLGSNLARLEIKIALEEILSRLPDYQLAEGWTLCRKRGFVQGPENLPVTFTPGKRLGSP